MTLLTLLGIFHYSDLQVEGMHAVKFAPKNSAVFNRGCQLTEVDMYNVFILNLYLLISPSKKAFSSQTSCYVAAYCSFHIRFGIILASKLRLETALNVCLG